MAELTSQEIREWRNRHESQFGRSDFIDALCDLALRGLDDAEDAERYRWFAGDVPQHSTRWQRWKLEHWHGFHGGWQPLTGSELDEAIDAAMETENAK